MRSLPKRHPTVPSTSVALCLTSAALVACADSPTTGPRPRPQLAALPTCEWIDFNNFAQGQSVTGVSVLGLNLTVSTTAFPDPSNVANPFGAVAFETDGLNDDLDGVGSIVMEDDDLQYRGEDSPFDGDLDGGECPDCAGLGKILVVQNPAGFVPQGDYEWGGRITFSGDFSTPGYQYYINSYTALDVDQNEPGISLFVDGTLAAQSPGPADAGNGSVRVVPVTTVYPITSDFAFQLGTPQPDEVFGSGGIDNIQVCRVQTEVTGNEGCTLGYWKQDQHFDSWVTYTPSQDLSTVFDLASFTSLGGDSFLEALNYKGGPDAISAARLLLKQAVAGLLNAASPDVDYALTTQQIISQVEAALASGSRSAMLTLASTLDGYNNANCTLH